MRLWHYKILPYLPTSQLKAQKRECDLILKDYWQGGQTNHILINYIHTYSDYSFNVYYSKLFREFRNRGIRFNDTYNRVNFAYAEDENLTCFGRHQDNEYLTICYYNLKEKYLRGQKDFSKECWDKLEQFYKKEIK